MIEPNEKPPHHEGEQEKTLRALFSKRQQAVLRERLSQDAFRHFEDSLHGKRVPSEAEVEEWRRAAEV